MRQAQKFEKELRRSLHRRWHRSYRLIGLSYLGLGIGTIFGVALFSALSDKMLKKQAKGGEITPEYRLPLDDVLHAPYAHRTFFGMDGALRRKFIGLYQFSGSCLLVILNWSLCAGFCELVAVG